MRNIWNVMKKDLDKIFKYPRMIFSTILLPGFLLFVIYALMGSTLSRQITEITEREQVIHIYNVPNSFQPYVDLSEEMNIRFEVIQESDFDLNRLKDLIEKEQIEVLVVFDAQFDSKLGVEMPTIDTYYNPTTSISSQTYSSLQVLLMQYQSNIIEGLLQQHGLTSVIYELSVEEVHEERKVGAGFLAMILPMLIITFIFSGSLSLGSDAIAGEKERGTLPTLLMAPIKRSAIIYGKIFSTTIISVLTAISSFIGIVASFPFAKDMFAIDGVTLSYGFADYLGLLGLFIVVALLASSMILIGSTFAKTTKEASMYAMPLYIIALLASVFSIFSEKIPTEIGPYLIPIYNATLGMKGILMFQIEGYQLLLIFGSSFVFAGCIIALLVRLFKSEYVLFSK